MRDRCGFVRDESYAKNVFRIPVFQEKNYAYAMLSYEGGSVIRIIGDFLVKFGNYFPGGCSKDEQESEGEQEPRP